MSDYKKEAKSVSAARMQRMGLKLADGSKSFDDMNGGSPFEGLNSGHAGKWPISPSKFKRGGKVAHMLGEKAHKNLGKTPRKAVGGARGNPVPLPPPRPKDMDKVPLPPRRAPDEEYSAYNPDEPSDLGSRSTEARGGNVSRKQAAAIAYKKQGAGMSRKMGIPKMKGLPNLAADTYVPHKRGGMAKHPDEAQDRKLVKQMVKPNALRAHKNVGGSADDSDSHENWMKRREEIGREVAAKKAANPGKSFSQIMLDEVGNLGRQHGEYLKNRRANPMSPERQQAMAEGRDDGPSMVDMYGKNQKSGKFAHGGKAKRSHKLVGGPITSNNPMLQNPGMMRKPGMPPMNANMNPMARPMRATGGRTKGKTNVNIIISPQSGGQGQGVLGAGVGMGQPPVPPMMPPVPPQMPPMPQGGMPPAGGAGGGLPPQLMAALATRGGAGSPPMARKTGGRVDQKMPKYQEKDYGSGSGLGRLEKRKWPVADGTE